MDVFDYLTRLEQERYRAVLLHADPEKSPSLTAFCRKVCQRVGGRYLDVLDLFMQSKALSARIDRFGPEELRALLIEQSRASTLLVVDRADFLLDAWRKPERQKLYRMARDQWDGYKEGMEARLVMSLQTSPEIEALTMRDSQGQSRVVRLTDFNDIA